MREETAQLTQQHEELSETRATAVANGTRHQRRGGGTAGEDDGARSEAQDAAGMRPKYCGSSAPGLPHVRRSWLRTIEHIEATCLNDLAVVATVLREDAAIARIEGEALVTEEEESRALKQRLEAPWGR